jgi:arylsulfatase A-like enzyme
VHAVPPHEPYLPGPEHDLFGDPSYAGRINGSYRQMQRIFRGELQLDEADVARLVSLYDGNLRRGDALVGDLVSLWRERRPGRPLLVICLSDHGEALGEHGHFGHNLPLTDETTRVPLIWASDLPVSPGLDRARDRLLALTDVMPMLLHELGLRGEALESAGPAWPARFLEVLERPDAPRTEVLLRNTEPRLRGVRTVDRLLISDGWARQELYDLTDDPRARHDLRWARPEEFAGLEPQLLRPSDADGTPATGLEGPEGSAVPVAAPEKTPPAAADSSSAVDERMLRSLGYL